MKKLDLRGKWKLEFLKSKKAFEAQIPGTDYGALISCGEIDDPFYADNELKALYIADEDKSFSRVFTVDGGFLDFENRVLRCLSRYIPLPRPDSAMLRPFGRFRPCSRADRWPLAR